MKGDADHLVAAPKGSPKGARKKATIQVHGKLVMWVTVRNGVTCEDHGQRLSGPPVSVERMTGYFLFQGRKILRLLNREHPSRQILRASDYLLVCCLILSISLARNSCNWVLASTDRIW